MSTRAIEYGSPVCGGLEYASLGSTRRRQLEYADSLAARPTKPRTRTAPPAGVIRDRERTRLRNAEADNEAAEARERQCALEERRQRQAGRWARILQDLVEDPAEWRWVERVAYHEAGHALLLWSNGAGVEEVGLELVP